MSAALHDAVPVSEDLGRLPLAAAGQLLPPGRGELRGAAAAGRQAALGGAAERTQAQRPPGAARRRRWDGHSGGPARLACPHRLLHRLLHRPERLPAGLAPARRSLPPPALTRLRPLRVPGETVTCPVPPVKESPERIHPRSEAQPECVCRACAKEGP